MQQLEEAHLEEALRSDRRPTTKGPMAICQGMKGMSAGARAARSTSHEI